MAESDGGRVACDVEIVFERDGEAVERTDGFSGAVEFEIEFLGAFDGVGEHDDGETVGL